MSEIVSRNVQLIWSQHINEIIMNILFLFEWSKLVEVHVDQPFHCCLIEQQWQDEHDSFEKMEVIYDSNAELFHRILCEIND